MYNFSVQEPEGEGLQLGYDIIILAAFLEKRNYIDYLCFANVVR